MQVHVQELSKCEFLQKGGVKGATSPQQVSRSTGMSEDLFPMAWAHGRTIRKEGRREREGREGEVTGEGGDVGEGRGIRREWVGGRDGVMVEE